MYLSEVEGAGGISAKVVAHTLSTYKPDMITLELNYPRFIHAEFMTHRMFSRNASSSRAIPVDKMLKQIRENPAMPIHWGKNQPGMQAREAVNSETRISAEYIWENAAANAALKADILSVDLSIHKQVANRIIEPYQFIKVVCTATEWDNFFELRLHEDAQPEIYELARVMKEAIESSEGTHENCHLPYIVESEKAIMNLATLKKCSVARCARVSYKNHDKSNPNPAKDEELHDMLLEAGHMSPFEHVAWPMHGKDVEAYCGGSWEQGATHMTENGIMWSGNFRSWVQYRQAL